MIALIENILLALTDAQFDKVLAMIERGFMAIEAGVKAAWSIVVPLIGAWVAYKCQEIIKNQKSNRQALDQNTALTETAIVTSNGYNEKIAASLKEIAELKLKIKELEEK
jgi:hypothetical protein